MKWDLVRLVGGCVFYLLVIALKMIVDDKEIAGL